MKLQMHSINFEPKANLLDFVQRKVSKLETFHDHIVDAEVYLKLNNEGIQNKTVEIKINIPGNQVFAKEQAKSFEEATDLTTEALRRQIKKYKEKIKIKH